MLQPIVKPAPDFTPVTSKRPRSCPCSPESSHQRHANSSSSTSNAAPSLGLASLSSAQAPKLNDLTTPHQQTRHRAPDSAVAAASLPAMQPPTIPVIAIEAIIGAGKSTLLEAIKQRFGDAVVVVPEPVNVWTNVDGHNLLGEYYKDQKRWAFSFQSFAMMSRVAAVKEAFASAVVPGVTKCVVMERSWFSDRACFAALLHDSGAMDELEEAMHKKMFEWGLQSGGWPTVDGFVYLEVDIDVAQGRVAKRGRCEESSIPSEYQLELHKKHQAWIQKTEAEHQVAVERAEEMAAATAATASSSSLLAQVAETPIAPVPANKSGKGADDEDEEVASPTSVGDDFPHLAKKQAVPHPEQSSSSFSSSSASASLSPFSPAPVTSAPRVLRLDCSVENSGDVVHGWLGAIDNFVDQLAARA